MSKETNNFIGLEAFLENNSELRDTTYIDPSTLIASYSQLQLIYGFGRALCSETKLDKIPVATVEALVKIINLERCFIAILNEKNSLEPIIKYNIDLPEKFENWPVSKSVINRVIKDGMPLLLVDTLKDKNSHQSMYLNQISTIMCVPLGIKGSVKGVIYADSKRVADKFSKTDLLFLIALSHYVYLSLINSTQINSKNWSDNTIYQNVLINEMLSVGLVGRSKLLQQAYQRLKRVADKELPVLIYGETGTGKELFAQAAHKLNANRSKKIFLSINIAALSETIIESELFGHEKGAFSGATQTKLGKLELANGGTLFLDEVAEIPLKTQAKLLRVLENGYFERVGGLKTLHTNIRLVSATNKNLEELIKKGEFRADLYYRLKGLSIVLPALRERAEDIPEIIKYYLSTMNSAKSFSQTALTHLQSYSWPGNVRQLLRLVEELDATCENALIDSSDLPHYLLSNEDRLSFNNDLIADNFLPLNELVSQVECSYIKQALDLAKGNNDKAIELLGISRAKFFDRKKVYGL
ncbi:MAG: sigma-54-dependent Fis family transcriptional regulator [Blastocatellia bacterium]|nr:sigma-54-dependent Fis family transcriptional regulator [Blastocatellia bacterium]